MANLRSVDMMLVDDLFDMHGGFVLKFSDRTFGEFFRNEVGIDIDDPKFSVQGGSKAKRLRYFLQTVDRATTLLTLTLLWDMRHAINRRTGEYSSIKDAETQFNDLIVRLGDQAPKSAAHAAPSSVDKAKFAELQRVLMDLAQMAAQPRGYAFEKFLKDQFNTFNLEARSPFKLVGEQIDGSFLLGHETYLSPWAV